MPVRRSHKKSRAGCFTCKQRRVKASQITLIDPDWPSIVASVRHLGLGRSGSPLVSFCLYTDLTWSNAPKYNRCERRTRITLLSMLAGRH